MAQGVDDLRAALEAQREACAEVLRRKDELAAELRTALKEKDNQYADGLSHAPLRPLLSIVS